MVFAVINSELREGEIGEFLTTVGDAESYTFTTKDGQNFVVSVSDIISNVDELNNIKFPMLDVEKAQSLFLSKTAEPDPVLSATLSEEKPVREGIPRKKAEKLGSNDWLSLGLVGGILIILWKYK